jgi:adenylosuccinate lyase
MSSEQQRNLMMPGHPRYQPKSLVPVFGYDNLYRPFFEVEFATLETLAEIGVVPAAEFGMLTEEMRANVLSITTSEVDAHERAVTKHDIRALIHVMQQRLPAEIAQPAGFFHCHTPW